MCGPSLERRHACKTRENGAVQEGSQEQFIVRSGLQFVESLPNTCESGVKISKIGKTGFRGKNKNVSHHHSKERFPLCPWGILYRNHCSQTKTWQCPDWYGGFSGSATELPLVMRSNCSFQSGAHNCSICAIVVRLSRGKKSIHHHRGTPPFSVCHPTPRTQSKKKLLRIPPSFGKQGKRIYTISPERRVYTIEASNPEKEKRRVSTVVLRSQGPPTEIKIAKSGK